MIKEIILLAAIAWWISEGSNLMAHLRNFLYKFNLLYKKDFDGNKIPLTTLPLFECAKCLGFWLGYIYFDYQDISFLKNVTLAILVSAVSIFISKVFWKIR